GILAIDANFYEFIPETEIGGANPTMLTCAELDEGGTYHIVLTTPGGLYRYDINDVVRVTGFYNQTQLIKFIRKGRDVSNINVEYAQKRESRRLAAPVLWVMKSGWFDGKARSTLQRAGGAQFKSQLLTTVPEDPSEALLIIEKTSEELK